MRSKAEQYLEPLLKLYDENRNTEKASYMKKYLKNKFEFFGLMKDRRVALEKEFYSKYGKPEYAEIADTVKQLWTYPERECQHTAIVLSGKYVGDADDEFLDLIEYMILNKSWWDTVDFIATKHAGTYLNKRPDKIKQVTWKWMSSGELWLQRSALLFQLNYKKDTDFDLMKSYILELAHSKEFFIRKAIGWVLREYSKTNAAEVIDFVKEAPITNFSKTEALKWLNRKKS